MFALPSRLSRPAWHAAAAFAVVIGTALPAGAQSATCGGRNMLDELKASEPAVYAEIRKAADATKNSKALLWKIEQQDQPDRPPSYLFGTIHLTDDRLHTLSPAVIEAMGSARRVALEVEDLSQRRIAEALAGMKKDVFLPAGATLDAKLSVAERQRAKVMLARAGMPADAMSRVRPWVAMAMTATSECEKSRQASGKRTLDAELAERAERHGIGTMGLETVESQFEAMAGVPEADQLALLKASLAGMDRINDMTETMVQIYLKRDLGLLLPLQMALAKKAGIDPKAFDSFQEHLLVVRNKRMRDRAVMHLQRGGLFIGVGALHLVGDTGMVALLEELGFTLTAVE